METVSTLSNRLIARGKFRHIQVLLKLAELGSVQRTGEAIGMTQSAVTQALAYIERLVGTQLFHRHARGISPTPACTALLPVVRNLMQGIQDGAETLHAQQLRGLNNVRLMASAAAVNGILLRALPVFHAHHPAIQVQLKEAEGDDQLLAVARKEIDLVVCRRPNSLPEGWAFRPLFDDRLTVVSGAGHPLAGRSRVRWADLANERWVLAPAGTIARQQLDELAQAQGLRLHTYPLVTRSLPLLHSLLSQDKLVALLPLSFIQPQIDAGELKSLKLTANLPLEPLGVLLPQWDASPSALALAEFLACA